jgi:hypothetical protein
MVESEGLEPSAGVSVRRTAAPRPTPQETTKANVHRFTGCWPFEFIDMRILCKIALTEVKDKM